MKQHTYAQIPGAEEELKVAYGDHNHEETNDGGEEEHSTFQAPASSHSSAVHSCLNCKWLLLVTLVVLTCFTWVERQKARYILFFTQEFIEARVWSRFHPLPEGIQPTNFSFPSVDERVQYYMSNWYDVPEDYTSGQNKSSSVCNDIQMCVLGSEKPHGRPVIETKECLEDLARIAKFDDTYGSDTLLFLKHLKPEQLQNNPKLVVVFGDSKPNNPKHPIFSKARYTKEAQPHARHPVTSQAMLLYLHAIRHYGPVKHAVNYYSWNQKKETLIFRGGDSGHEKRLAVVQHYNQKDKYSLKDLDIAFTRHFEETKNFAYNHSTSWPIYRNYLTQSQLLRYKYLLVLEGNDVSTGLKWMLFSNSVVFMAKPTMVSWAMEELLVPYVHYIPLQDDHSDVLEQLEWARQHDDECELISKQATQYMYDLHMSEQASKDREEILSKMIQRYYENYESTLSDC